jgi:hypothetical protein
MAKVTRGSDGKLYNGKGTKGGLAPTPPTKGKATSKLPKLPAAPTVPAAKTTKSVVKKVKTHTLPDISNIEVPENLLETTEGIELDASSIEFPNHNSASKKEWMTLEELISKDKYYDNNCDAVSGEVYNYLEEMQYEFEGISNVDLVQLDYAKGAHVAVSVANEDREDWVIDYTAKQFDTSLPVPLVLPKKTWEDLIDGYIWAKHKDSRI